MAVEPDPPTEALAFALYWRWLSEAAALKIKPRGALSAGAMLAATIAVALDMSLPRFLETCTSFYEVATKAKADKA